MASSLADAINASKKDNLISMGFSIDIYDLIKKHLAKDAQTIISSNVNGVSSSSGGYGFSMTNPSFSFSQVLGLGTTNVSKREIRSFEGDFSTDIDDPLWKVVLSYTHPIPILDSKNGGYALAKIDGENHHKIFSKSGNKCVPPVLDNDHAEASKKSSGADGFEVGCYLDIDKKSVEYFNLFYKMPTNKEWSSSHLHSLIGAKCLYVELISNKGYTIPLRVLGSMTFDTGQIKIVTALAGLAYLKQMEFPLFINGGGETINLNESKDVTFVCKNDSYDYLKSVINNYNSTRFSSWASGNKATGVDYTIIQPKTDTGVKPYYIRFFIPEEKKSDATFAMKDGFKIPENLFKPSTKIKHKENEVIENKDHKDSPVYNYTGMYESMITSKSKSLFELCKGVINDSNNLLKYSQAERPHSFDFFNDDTITESGITRGTNHHELVKLLRVGKYNKNGYFAYDCSSFVQALLYSTLGLNRNVNKVNVVLDTKGLIQKGVETINQYVNESYVAQSLEYDVKKLIPGDILVRDGHAAMFVGANGFRGASNNSTIEFHGSAKNKTLAGKAKENSYEIIIRMVASNIRTLSDEDFERQKDSWLKEEDKELTIDETE